MQHHEPDDLSPVPRHGDFNSDESLLTGRPTGEKSTTDCRLFRSRLWMPLLTVALGLAFFSGCVPRQKFNFKASSCLNPVESGDQGCEVDERDSRPLAYRLYPLSQCPDLTNLKWADFLEDAKDKDMLADFWLEAPEERLIERLEAQAFSREYPRKTRCLLVVTIGRREGARSLEVLKIRWWPHRVLKKEHLVIFDRVDVHPKPYRTWRSRVEEEQNGEGL